MTPEQVQQIAEAAKAGEAAKLQELLAAIEKSAVDKAAGVGDVTEGLKAKNAELLGKLAAQKAEADKAAEELANVKRQAEEAKAKAEAENHGVDNAAVEKLAEERADRKFQAKVAEWEQKTKMLEDRAAKGDQDRELLVKRLKAAHVDHELYKVAGADVDPILFPYFRDKAEQHFQPRANGEGDWWREDVISFDLIDPSSKTRLMNDQAKPMTPEQLVQSRKAGEWSAFFLPKGKGGGATSQTSATGKEPLPWDAPASAFLERAGIK